MNLSKRIYVTVLLSAAGCSSSEDGGLGVRQSLESAVPETANSRTYTAADPTEIAKIQAYLDERTPPSAIVSTIRGTLDEFDCIPRDQQISVRQLKARGIDVDPNVLVPQNSKPAKDPTPPVDSEHPTERTVQNVSGVCPDGTIPVRRIPVNEIAEYGSLEKWQNRPTPNVSVHSHATVRYYSSTYGNEALLNIWQPYAENSGEFNLSQLWAVGGSGSSRQTVEIGAQNVWGQGTKLFIYYTTADYASGTGCYNTDCSGFVQTDSGVYLGAGFDALSASGGDQREAFFGLYKDGDTGDWWARFGDHWAGYWPHSLFNASTGIGTKAISYIEYGGEVYDNDSARRTGTDMGGDGSFASSGWQHASYQRWMRYYSSVSGGYFYWDEASSLSSSEGYVNQLPACWSLGSDSYDTGWGEHFYFGGPGYGGSCN